MKKYYNNENYIQNFFKNKKKIEKIINLQSEENLKNYKFISINNKKPFQFINFIKLAYTRKFFREIINKTLNLGPPKEFLEILNKTNNYLKDKNTKLIFVYLPKNNDIRSNPKFLKPIKKLDIKVIDIGKELEKFDNKRSLFPKSGIHHFNEFGYKVVSDIILKYSKINFN